MAVAVESAEADSSPVQCPAAFRAANRAAQAASAAAHQGCGSGGPDDARESEGVEVDMGSREPGMDGSL